jgi:signal transduction histidine kinase
MSFASRLVWGTILVIIVAIAVHVVGAEIALRGDLDRESRHTLEREALLIARGLPPDSADWQGAVESIARVSELRITLIARDGRVVAESEAEPEGVSRIENHGERPEVLAALAGGVGSDRRHSATVNRSLLYVAVPAGPGVLRLAAPLAGNDAILNNVHRAFLGAALVALLIGAGLAFFAGRSIAQPLTTISLAARSIAQGAQPRFPRSGVPDIDELIRALREMHAQLDQRFTELRRERAESAALVEAMIEGVIASDPRGRIVTANGAARRLLGYEPEDTLPDLEHIFRVKAAREAVDAVLGGQSVLERELELDGQSVLLSARPLAHGGALLVLHDVTELRRLETVRRDFVANVSHELKTPLTSISGYAETLVQEPADGETTRRFLTVILSNARRMQRLVDGLLDLSRIESGGWRPAPEPLDVAAVARESWGLLADRAELRQIGYSAQVAPDAGSVTADPDAVRQVLSNLFDNAIRHTPAGGRVTFSAARDDGGVTLEVRDTGAGITGEHLPRIFERFYRADHARARDDGGTGLGLAIVKHLVEAHDGQVSATSQVGRGTAIRCWFPDGGVTTS